MVAMTVATTATMAATTRIAFATTRIGAATTKTTVATTKPRSRPQSRPQARGRALNTREVVAIVATNFINRGGLLTQGGGYSTLL